MTLSIIQKISVAHIMVTDVDNKKNSQLPDAPHHQIHPLNLPELPCIQRSYRMSGKKVNVGVEGETPKVYFSRKSLKKRVDVGVEGATPKKFINTNANAKRVNLGIEGMTPKKVVNADGTTRAYHFFKKVDVGDEGHTPIKTFEYFSNIPIAAAPNKPQFSQSVSAITKNNKLNTIHEFLPPPPPQESTRERSSSAENSVKIYPEEKSSELVSPSGRPKTSRGKSHPSPDEFFDYVVPSPPPRKNKTTQRVEVNGSTKQFSTDAMNEAVRVIVPPVPPAAVSTWRSEDEEENEYGDGVDETDDSAGGYGDGDEPQVEAEEEIYDVSGVDAEGASEESWEAQQLRHIHMGGENEHRNKQVRMLGCWLFGSALRI